MRVRILIILLIVVFIGGVIYLAVTPDDGQSDLSPVQSSVPVSPMVVRERNKQRVLSQVEATSSLSASDKQTIVDFVSADQNKNLSYTEAEKKAIIRALNKK